MKKILLTAACAATLGAGVAAAQESPWSISGSLGIVSDYMFRGLSQTGGDAALQGGATVSHDSGFYAGLWGSNVDFGDDTDFELDVFVGYTGALDEKTSYDVNVTYFSYPNAPSGSDYDYFELGAGITHDFDVASIGVKAAYSPEFFGKSGDAFWLGGNLTVPVNDWISASGNIGYQWLEPADSDYFHYDLGVTASFDIVSLDVRYVGTDIEGEKEKFVGSVIFNF